MASVSASHLIIFIASILVAASVAGVLTNTVGELSQAVDELGLDVSDDVRTDIEFISDSGATVYDRSGNGNITLYVKNTGSQSLPPDPVVMDVLLDGRFQTDFSVTVVDGETWAIGNVVRMDISAPDLSSGDHRVQITINGDEEVFEFRT
ncbi:flagellar protein G [Halorhabdus sp. CBA1104]|uniref:flagellar protein G n=1 Tax=unclassified Halorhabdus TaxID=2621901 RepID=UPI0012B3DADB|nr:MULTISPECIES: flagellar protein G [unclassified Halorhabdus]QGN07192.1 flagellar protein G [Halorhabdus sp. CBA1104]